MGDFCFLFGGTGEELSGEGMIEINVKKPVPQLKLSSLLSADL